MAEKVNKMPSPYVLLWRFSFLNVIFSHHEMVVLTGGAVKSRKHSTEKINALCIIIDRKTVMSVSKDHKELL